MDFVKITAEKSMLKYSSMEKMFISANSINVDVRFIKKPDDEEKDVFGYIKLKEVSDAVIEYGLVLPEETTDWMILNINKKSGEAATELVLYGDMIVSPALNFIRCKVDMSVETKINDLIVYYMESTSLSVDPEKNITQIKGILPKKLSVKTENCCAIVDVELSADTNTRIVGDEEAMDVVISSDKTPGKLSLLIKNEQAGLILSNPKTILI